MTWRRVFELAKKLTRDSAEARPDTTLNLRIEKVYVIVISTMEG